MRSDGKTTEGFFKPYSCEDDSNIGEVVNNDEGASTVTLQARKRKTSKQVRNEEPKPKVRSKTRAHQNWNERYLTNKKKVDTLQPDHNLPRDFIYAVRNNMHDPKVRGAAKTAGKLMVYGRGETIQKPW